MAALAGLIIVMLVIIAPDRVDLADFAKATDAELAPKPVVVEEPVEDPFTLRPVPVLLDGRVVEIEPFENGLLALMSRPGQAPGTTPRLLNSNDGVEWANVDTAVTIRGAENSTEYQWAEFGVQGNELFLVALDGSTYELFRSTNGIDWEHFGTPTRSPLQSSRVLPDATGALIGMSDSLERIYRIQPSTLTLSISSSSSSSLSGLPLDSTTYTLDVPVPAVESTAPFADGVVLHASDEQIFYDTSSGTWLIDVPSP